MSSLLNVKQAAESLGLTAKHLYTLVERRELSHVRVGRLIRFSQEDLDEFVKNRRVASGLELPCVGTRSKSISVGEARKPPRNGGKVL